MSGKKKRRWPLVIVVILGIFILIPLTVIGLSFIGRITPDSIIPDSFDVYATVPDPLRLAGRVLEHESLPDIIALAELAPLLPLADQLKNTGLAENRWFRMGAKGRLDAAVLPGGRLLVSWDAGIMSPFLKFLPSLAGKITIPGLYHVSAGRNSRFEYRLEDGTVFFIGTYRNLLVITNNSALFESVAAGASREGDRVGSAAKTISAKDYDIAFLLSQGVLADNLGAGDWAVAGATGGVNTGGTDSPGDVNMQAALNRFQFPGPIEASVSVLPGQLKIRLSSPLGTNSPALRKIIERNSEGTPLSAMIPGNAQYMTLLAMGSLQELLDGAHAAAEGTPRGAELEDALKKADSSAKMALGMSLEELLFSWTGSQFAVYGIEGRPNPVIAVEIRDEQKRKAVFDKAFSSIFLNENIQLNLDGNRIPRIQLPGFLDSFLSFLDINVPSPYYSVQNNYLLVSESAETLLAAVNAVRRNETLPKTELWRALSEDNSGPSSFMLFYSLDRSLPFFLNGRSPAIAVLRLYRQGLARLHLENKQLTVSLSVIPGAGKGIVPVPGYPLAIPGAPKPGNRLYKIDSGKDSRLLLTSGSSAFMVNPLDRTAKEKNVPGGAGTALYFIPAAETAAGQSAGSAAWLVNSQGYVSLLNRDMETAPNFPVSTGIKLSAPPAAWEGRLFLPGEDGAVYTLDSGAQVRIWGRAFSSALRSPPSFINFNNRTYAASYPKSFIGEIFILDPEGTPLPGWPVPVSGIAFGSPLLFSAPYPAAPERLYAAFITQAGELAVYTESAETLPGFPLELPGVFYLQPVFDGESLWIIESGGTLYKIGLDGEVLSQKIPRLSVRDTGYITAVRGGNGAAGPGGVFFTGEGNTLYGYARNFSLLEGFPLPVWGQPVFGDVNGDGKAEAAGVGMDNRVYMWQFRQGAEQ